MDATVIWNAALTVVIFLMGAVMRARDEEVKALKEESQRQQILLNRTREEVAKEYVTKAEVHADINRVLDRLDRLDAKLDAIIKEQGQHARS